jgi:UDP-N-acetylglucosamine 2-epimerase
MKSVSVVGARPNFMKVAPLLREMGRHTDVSVILVHTGQHYDEQMAGQCFRELSLPEPDVALGIGPGSSVFQTAEVLKRLEPVLEAHRPDVVLVQSGGLQEETTALGVACLTLRDNTERPVTVTHGTNQVVGRSGARILDAAYRLLETAPERRTRPPLWDGHAAERIVAVLRQKVPAS